MIRFIINGRGQSLQVHKDVHVAGFGVRRMGLLRLRCAFLVPHVFDPAFVISNLVSLRKLDFLILRITTFKCRAARTYILLNQVLELRQYRLAVRRRC